MTNTRFHASLWLGLLLVSCDKPAETATSPEAAAAPPRVTKLDRSRNEELPPTPAELRAQLTTATQTEDPEGRNKAMAEVIWNALDLDPILAEEGFQKLTPGSEEKNRLIQHRAMRQAEHDLDGAIEWAAALESEQEKSLAYDSIALVLAETEPLRAAQMLSDSGIAGHDFDVAVVQVIQRWAAISATDAAAWVVLFEPGEARRAGLKEIVATWSRANPEAAIAWVEAQEDPSIHQEAVTGMAQAILEMPEAGQGDLMQLTTPEIRAALDKLQAESASK